jgi:hypothetical protein
MLQPLYPQGRSLFYPLDRRLGGLQSRSGSGGEEKNSQPLPKLEPPIIQPIAQRYTAELCRLLTISDIVRECCFLTVYLMTLYQLHKQTGQLHQ